MTTFKSIYHLLDFSHVQLFVYYTIDYGDELFSISAPLKIDFSSIGCCGESDVIWRHYVEMYSNAVVEKISNVNRKIVITLSMNVNFD